MDIFAFISLAGGIALFLYGMSIMGSGLEKIAGGKMEGILKKLTSSTIMSVITGALLTGVIQSSAATTVIVIGLVNSGIMMLPQAIGVIMGANIGTTITGQIIRLGDIGGDNFWLRFLKPTTIAPIVAFVGAILFVFFKTPKKRNIGQIMLGFGILFTGMFTMEAAVAPLRESELFLSCFAKL
ncbi:MAG: Na/Pi symporter, partial [Pygmaiobacter sp.]